jgi:hypothetical protein
MKRLVLKQGVSVVCLTMLAAVFLLTVSLASCNKPAQTTSEKDTERTFGSPDEAGVALLGAAKSGDHATLLSFFGPDADEIVSSGDPVKDKNALQDFVEAYNQMHRWREIAAGGEMLFIGADNFAFPIPLGKNSSGRWFFDTAAGKDEILARRIGKDELVAIAACSAIADAQQKYFNQTHDGEKVKQYAEKFVSDAGKQNGLFWPATDDQTASPLGQLGDFAKAAGYTNSGDKPQPFNGYYFRILTKQGNVGKDGAQDYVVNGKLTGGFAILAYPTNYRDSGIMTFIVGKDGVVYQKDLGEKTDEVSASMTEYNPADGWKPAL